MTPIEADVEQDNLAVLELKRRRFTAQGLDPKSRRNLGNASIGSGWASDKESRA